MLSALPFRSEPGLMLTRVLYLCFTLLCSCPLWFFCQHLWRRHWPWPQAMLAAAAASYPLGCVSTMFVNLLTNHLSTKPESFDRVLLSAFSATSPFCVLMVWCVLYFGLKHHERNARVELLARQAELRSLRHQLTPHFLCNTLNGISTLVGEGRTQEARRMIARLGDFLRATLDGSGALEVSLAQEVSYLQQYLAIEQARLGARLGVRIEIAPEALDASVPNLLLQPLVENAVQHGVVPFPDGGDVTISAGRRNGRVCLSVANRARRAAAGSVEGKPALADGLAGVGLRNTEERLGVTYGAAATIVYQRQDAQSWTTTIELPYQVWSSATQDLPA